MQDWYYREKNNVFNRNGKIMSDRVNGVKKYLSEVDVLQVD